MAFHRNYGRFDTTHERDSQPDRQTDAARRQRPRFDAQRYPSGDITAHGDYRLVGSGYEYRLVLVGIQKIPHLVCRG